MSQPSPLLPVPPADPSWLKAVRFWASLSAILLVAGVAVDLLWPEKRGWHPGSSLELVLAVTLQAALVYLYLDLWWRLSKKRSKLHWED